MDPIGRRRSTFRALRYRRAADPSKLGLSSIQKTGFGVGRLRQAPQTLGLASQTSKKRPPAGRQISPFSPPRQPLSVSRWTPGPKTAILPYAKDSGGFVAICDKVPELEAGR